MVALALSFLVFNARAAAAPTCPAPKLCESLVQEVEACAKKDAKACDAFVGTVEKLLPKYDCSRDFDEGAHVPAIWLCGSGHERSLALLSTMKDKKARALFGSPALRATLDGHLAEEYRAKSEKAGKPR